MSVQAISVAEFAKLREQGPVELIDVRTPLEYSEVHAQGARNIPLDQLDPQTFLDRQNGAASQTVYVICKMGSRGVKACHKFAAAGYQDAINIAGGTQAWQDAGLPVVRGQKTISLERQVRIVAGTVILVSSLLAITVNVNFAGVAAFIGAGLAFAGMTDTCGMAMLLARMPWNRVKTSESCCTTSKE